MIMSGPGDILAPYTATVTHVATPVSFRVAVQDFLIITRFWHANPVMLSRYGRKVADYYQFFGWVPTTPQKSQGTIIGVS